MEQGIHTYPSWEEDKHVLSGLFCRCLPDITSVEGQDHILRPIVSHRRLDQ